MSRIPRHLNLHIKERPRWYATDKRSELTYLGWGLRDYARYPSTHTEEREIWSYTVILRGTPTILLGDGPHRLSPQEAVLLSGHGHYPLGMRDEGDGLSEVLIWIWRTPPSIHRVRPPLGGYQWCRMSPEACHRLQNVHASCRREADNYDRYTRHFLAALRAEVDIEFARALDGVVGKSSDRRRAELAARWLQENLRQENPIFLLCDYLQVSHSTVVRLFRNAFGVSPTEYYRRLRMQEARRLLDETKLSAKQVAYRLGYKHPSDFSRAIKTFQRQAARKS